MKAIEAQKSMMENHIIDQLHALGEYQTDGLSYRELVIKLAAGRAKHE